MTFAATFKIASEALKFGSKMDKESKGTDKQGRNYRHWSYTLHMMVMVAGGATAIACGLVGQTIIMVLAGALTVTNALAAHNIKKFAQISSLNDVVTKLAQKVKNLFQANRELAKTADQLQEIVDDNRETMEQDIENWREKTEEIKTQEKTIRSLTTKLEKTTEVAAMMTEAVERFTKESEEFCQSEQHLGVELSQFKELHQNLNKRKEELKERVKDLEDETEEYDALNEELSGQVGMLDKQLSVMKEMHSNAKARLEERKEQLIQLEASKDTIDHNITRMQEVNERYEKAVEQLEKKIILLERYAEWMNDSEFHDIWKTNKNDIKAWIQYKDEFHQWRKGKYDRDVSADDDVVSVDDGKFSVTGF